jgi:DNA-binding LacI/PurR family transcriptional regulator
MGTIYDIAKEAGLSPSTVARALNGKGYCSKASKAKVEQIAKKLKYIPFQAAKSLRSKITQKVMLCIPDILNPYYFSMIKGVSHVLEKYGYYTILGYTGHDSEKELRLVESLKERFVDGLIMVSFDFNTKLLQAMYDSGMPVVITNYCGNQHFEQDFDQVYVDHTKAVYLAVKHCIEKGHRRIAFVGGSLHEQTGKERFSGYRKALEENNIMYSEDLILQSDFTLNGGHKTFRNFLETKKHFTAVVCCNDLMGIGCLNACKEAGLDIAKDYSLVTLDNTDYCICTTPKLSSIDMMQDKIGLNAANFLMEQILSNRGYKKTMILTPYLVARDSVVSI